MTLTGAQMEALQTAIGGAFTVDTLAQCVRFKLDRDLEDVTLAGNKQSRIFDLLDAADREGWTETLLIGLKNCNEQPELRAAINAVLGMQPIASAIDGRVLQRLITAIEQAMAPADLATLLCGLGRPRDDICEPPGYHESLFLVLFDAIREDWIDDLLAALLDSHASNELDGLIVALRTRDLDRLDQIRVTVSTEANQAWIASTVQPERQVLRLQIHAVELVQAGQADQAVAELKRGEQVLNVLLAERPADAMLTLQKGYYHKTFAQALDLVGEEKEAEAHCQRAATLAKRVLQEMPAAARTAQLDAGAYNLLGNVAAIRHDPMSAIDFYAKATTLDPGYAYAWHDMVAAYGDLAGAGEVRLEPMREAFEKVKSTGANMPGLGPDQLRLLERHLEFWERGGRG